MSVPNEIQTSTQNLFQGNKDPKFVRNKYPRRVSKRVSKMCSWQICFWGAGLTKCIFGLRGCFRRVSAGVARRLGRRAIENVTSKSQAWASVCRVSERHFSQLPGVSLKSESGATPGCAQGVREHTRRVYGKVSTGYPRPWWNHIFHWPSGKISPLEKVYAKGIRGYFEIGSFIYKRQ